MVVVESVAERVATKSWAVKLGAEMLDTLIAPTVRVAMVVVARLVFPVPVKLVVERFVEVELVIVALVATRLSVLVVEALVVLAFKVWKLPVVPHSVPMIA
jgi:hypothetical protein